MDFREALEHTLNDISDLLIEKNLSYGSSALEPLRIFSKSDSLEQINVRIDDKLSRLKSGNTYNDEDTELDLIGYLVLKRIKLLMLEVSGEHLS